MVRRTPARRLRPAKADTCQQVTALILAYATGELDPETTSAFKAHLKKCPDCIAFLNTYRKTVQLARSFIVASNPSGMHKRVRDFLRKKTKESGRRR